MGEYVAALSAFVGFARRGGDLWGDSSSAGVGLGSHSKRWRSPQSFVWHTRPQYSGPWHWLQRRIFCEDAPQTRHTRDPEGTPWSKTARLASC